MKKWQEEVKEEGKWTTFRFGVCACFACLCLSEGQSLTLWLWLTDVSVRRQAVGQQAAHTQLYTHSMTGGSAEITAKTQSCL